MEEEKIKGKSKQELWQEILNCYNSGKNTDEVGKTLGLSYEEIEDVMIENVDDEELKHSLETAKNNDKEFVLFKAYKKILSPKPNYIS